MACKKKLSSLFGKERVTMHFRNVLAAALILAVGLAAAGEDKPDRDALQTAQRQLRSRFAPQRVEAIERLRDLPTPEAAKLLAPRGWLILLPRCARPHTKPS